MTKKVKRIWQLLAVLSFLLNLGPLLAYTVVAYSNDTLVVQKVALSMTILVVVMLTLVGVANKVVYRSKVFLLVLGLYVCLESILTPLLIVSVCQVLDELIVTPLKKHYRTRYMIRKEMNTDE